jgi:hypothetical protein
MTVDTNAMRQMLEAAPGDRVAMDKDHVRTILDIVDAGQIAASAIANLCQLLPSQANAA